MGCCASSPEDKFLKAAAAGDAGIIQNMLSARGLDVNAMDAAKNTALILAARNGHYDVLMALLRFRAEANHVNSEGWTAMHAAAEVGLPPIVSLLKAHGGSSLIASTQATRGHTKVTASQKFAAGLTPVDVARQCGNEETLRILTQVEGYQSGSSSAGLTTADSAAQGGYQAQAAMAPRVVVNPAYGSMGGAVQMADFPPVRSPIDSAVSVSGDGLGALPFLPSVAPAAGGGGGDARSRVSGGGVSTTSSGNPRHRPLPAGPAPAASVVSGRSGGSRRTAGNVRNRPLPPGGAAPPAPPAVVAAGEWS